STSTSTSDYSAADRAELAALSKVLAQNAEAFGAEALARMFTVYAATKSYFKDYKDFTAAAPSIKAHGAKVVTALAKACDHLDDLKTHLHKLATFHGSELKVDPANFQYLSYCLEVALAVHLTEFSPETHCALDKFLTNVCHELSSRYR
uniref:Hemoglobin subunit alpha n=1 Tax=Heterodontus portusjacksoni TaxID=7793 RepID=HBA_HETPO|nr:RecName: Full=Hemoglobin subunit alpha; AltName: Full=Alpha-globin; AltName: Full=Hemoglobin alpha chain [Heterodontus portusjacksoni]prf//762100A hemoglobin alpha [Heterodontus portusjacksoni]